MKKILLLLLLNSFFTITFANNVVVQNVTLTGNNTTNKTIQVQFDLSWDNSWRDAINWDAAWLFLKFKDASGNWQHAQLNTTGFSNGTGTTNTVQVTSDKVGAWVYRSAQGSGTFNSTSMQLQWNYGLSGLTDITGLEVRVFGVEMVYVPEGEFNVGGATINKWDGYNPAASFYYASNGSKSNGIFNAPGNNFPIINTKLTPTLSYNDGTSTSLRIKGDVGIDTDNNGVVDNTTYPIGYFAFYSYKYELTEQQYADFLNTLTSSQIATLGVAGTSITLSNGQYFSSTPNKACGNSTAIRLLAYADWSGVRPMSFLEFNKASYGPIQPVYCHNPACMQAATPRGYPVSLSTSTCYKPVHFNSTLENVGYLATPSSDRSVSGASYYGILDLTGNAIEPVVKLNYFNLTTVNGNGVLTSNGNSDVSSWSNSNMVLFFDQLQGRNWSTNLYGFRYVRSAE
jgi:hypothetical protein